MNRSQGFTLIELMIVVAIVAILAAVAVPSYQDYVIASNRAVGRAVLLEVAGRQEQYFVNNNRYGTMVQLGYAATTVGVDSESRVAGSGTGVYDVSLSVATATTFTVQAVRTGSQLNDAECGTLTLTHLGVKGEGGTGTVTDCW
ncbi:prepilin-type N-terminal cleavage/methylation domain-containing protein [Pseudomaricurvus alkylphenolicus]|jgi:type IV pilus assembly protein PilE|uniref:type IV pilin protein n=1 Tax=Pseudomaricurvus alkylphenolicus TaxID=1306991 RepID=UPI0014249985|nr:type IV pilin protein [Pseudomaricurvus alkylphenolicus]NIB40241.1 prepilin-type N-terminal cleavage/methylation domain-containing protein [Pseudomaricurvus alkylphenolicus]